MTGNKAPYATLFGLPYGNTKEIAEGAIIAFGMPVQSASPRRTGTALGPAAIRETSYDALHTYRASPSQTVVDLLTGRMRRLRTLRGSLDIGDLAFNGPVSTEDIARIAELSETIAAKGGLPVALGGDHRAFEGIVRGLQSGPNTPAIISISNKITLPAAVDAEPMPLAFLTSGATGELSPVLCVGVNGLQSGDGWQALERMGGIIVSADDIYDARATALATINRFVGDHQSLVFCIDLEVIDAGYAAGTPAANVGGLTPEQLIDLLNEIDHPHKIAGVALTNVAPKLDMRGLTELAAAEALLAVLDGHVFEEVSG